MAHRQFGDRPGRHLSERAPRVPTPERAKQGSALGLRGCDHDRLRTVQPTSLGQPGHLGARLDDRPGARLPTRSAIRAVAHDRLLRRSLLGGPVGDGQWMLVLLLPTTGLGPSSGTWNSVGDAWQHTGRDRFPATIRCGLSLGSRSTRVTCPPPPGTRITKPAETWVSGLVRYNPGSDYLQRQGPTAIVVGTWGRTLSSCTPRIGTSTSTSRHSSVEAE